MGHECNCRDFKEIGRECEWFRSIIIMQKESQRANFVLSRVGLPYDATLPHQAELIFSQMLLGSLFIKGYRIAQQHHHTCIFYKRNNFNTQYLYLKFHDHTSELADNTHITTIHSAIKMVDDMKQTQQPNFRVILAFLEERSFLELDKAQFASFGAKPESRAETVRSEGTAWSRQVQSDPDKLVITRKEQLTKLKDIVWTYINTFGSKYKNNYYCDLEKRNPTSFNIEKLINTVNWIVYCETANKPYNQIETANWTCFERRAREKLKPDRKDILLTGSARTIMIHLLLLEKMDNYRKEYESEVSDVIFEFRKSFLEGEVKAYEISDELDQHNLIYRQKCLTLQKFSTL